jgi:hypothetical protein
MAKMNSSSTEIMRAVRLALADKNPSQSTRVVSALINAGLLDGLKLKSMLESGEFKRVRECGETTYLLLCRDVKAKPLLRGEIKSSYY